MSVVSFTGKCELESQENFEPFMKAIGLSDEMLKRSKDISRVSEIVQNGDHFKIVTKVGSDVHTNEFTLGKETDIQTYTGQKIKAIITLEGNKLIGKMKEMSSVTELLGDKLISTMTAGDIVYKSISKRIS
uniref:Fatty acid-binding protein, liver-like protein n=1 Tax=Callorhinchus milii TaxID=7868 RepID=K4G5E9_CALMI|nr:fatty acid-binding protein, liver-like protein [Callorhinchus milii]